MTRSLVNKAKAGVGEAMRAVKRVQQQAEELAESAISKVEQSFESMGSRMSHADYLAVAHMKQVASALTLSRNMCQMASP